MLKENWLNTVSSGSYKFTFYITDSDVWNDPFAWLAPTDETALSAGKAVIIAEDGVEGGFNIQNVNISSATASVRSGHTTIGEIQFDLNESLGFSFLDKILAVGAQLGKGTRTGSNFGAQLFVLKLDFVGRDPVTGAAVKYPDSFIYSMKAAEMNGSLGPAGAQYFMIMSPLEKLGQLDTVLTDTITLKNLTTASSFASALATALNDNQKRLSQHARNPHYDAMDIKPLINWKVQFDSTANIAAIEARKIPGFDLRQATWSGTNDPSTASGTSESLDTPGMREAVANPDTQLTAWVAEQLSINLPTFADYNTSILAKGSTFNVEVEQITKQTGEMHPHYNQEIRDITILIKLRRDDTATPPDEKSVIALRNTVEVQEERFASQILPGLIKKYSYQYTGDNLEVESVDIKLHSGFFNAVSPGVGVYYADNSFMFESNAPNAAYENSVSFAAGAPLQPAVQKANVRYLSDVKLDKFNVNQNSIFSHTTIGATGQMANETTEGSKIAAAALAAHANRLVDMQNMTVEVKGDPIFMGTNGKNLFNNHPDAIYMAFVNFQPDPDDLLNKQRRGPVDLVTTGIYKITDVHSKFSQGKFSQTVEAYRDPNSTPFLLIDTLMKLETN